jgi:hypothetical protein
MSAANTGDNGRKAFSHCVRRNQFYYSTDYPRNEDDGDCRFITPAAPAVRRCRLAAGALPWVRITAGALVTAGLFTGYGRRSTW